MRTKATVNALLPDGRVEVLIARKSACSGDCHKCAGCGAVEQTLERDSLRAVQTPQVFQADLLKAALQDALEQNVPITDDCSAVERLGKTVYLIEGDERNLKITTPVDLVVAEAILQAREER